MTVKALLQPGCVVPPATPPSTRRKIYVAFNSQSRILYIEHADEVTLEAVLALYEIHPAAKKVISMKDFMFWTVGMPDYCKFSELNLGGGFILLSDPTNDRYYSAMTAGQICELLNELETLRNAK